MKGNLLVKFRPRLQRWVGGANLPMAVLAFVYLVIYSIQVISTENSTVFNSLEIASNVIWAIFVLDLFLRLLAAESIKSFLASSWLEIIAITIPFLRMFRMLRVLVVMRGLKFMLQSRARVAGLYIAILVPLTWFMGAISVLDAESSNPESPITSLGTALWWSLSTITTVGYGDIYPVTFEGKIVAAILMITGIALFSAGAGIIASWIMGEKK